MAYLIFNKDNNISHIAASDLDRDALNIVLAHHTVKDVSDVDFLKIRTGVAIATYDGTNVTITDMVGEYLISEDNIKNYLKDSISQASDFLKVNENNPLYNPIKEYKNYLENFDSSSLGPFPYNKRIEQYFNENSITFYHPLQIP
tara:strand:+ start:76 stop:510 length:435 start_codon:yes stop_codon:yes gene_type:complete